MRCRQCDYRLWNLTERRCPECGEPFRPSEFEFAPNSVQFCCPHCGQEYYGTGPNGHLSPPAFSCVKCGAAIQMDEMVLRPAGGLQEEQTKAERMPWLERKDHGLAKRWLMTVWWAHIFPGRLMQALPDTSPTWAALGFAVLTLFVTVVPAAAPFAVFPLAMSRMFGGGVSQYILTAMASAILVTFGLLVLWTIIWGLAAHGLLRVTGKTAGKFGRTQQAICYSTGANLLTAIPCLGLYVGWIWWSASAVLMVKQAQRVHGGRAALAVLSPPLALLGCLLGVYIWFFLSFFPAKMSALQTRATTSLSKAETALVLGAVQRYAGEHAGHGPKHAAELVATGDVPANTFTILRSGTIAAAVPVGSTTLDKLAALPTEEAETNVTAAAEALPEGTIAHRLGDFVFVYHGIDLSAADGKLWVVIAAPEVPIATGGPLVTSGEVVIAAPGISAASSGSVPGVSVGCVDGSVTAIAIPDLPAALAAQNALRAEKGLPPLPDPMTVTHEGPAVAPP